MQIFSYLKYILLVFFLFTVNNKSFAGNDPFSGNKTRADSLKNILQTKPLTEKQQLDIYVGITDIYSAFDIDSVLVYAPKTIELARKLDKYDVETKNYFHLGAAYCFRNNYDSAFICFNKAKELAVKVKNLQSEASSLSLTAFAYVRQGKYLTAIDYYLKTLAVIDKTGIKNGGIGTLTNLAELNRKLNNPEQAIKYLNKAAAFCNASKSDNNVYYEWQIAQIYNEYAFNYLLQGNFDKTLEYALKSDSINTTGIYIVNKCDTKRLLAKIYLHKGDNERALQYAKEAMTQADQLKDNDLYIDVHLIFSDIYMAQKRYDEAEAEALKAWQIDSANIDKGRATACNIATANIYMHNTDKAAYFLKKYSEMNAQYSEKSFQTAVSDLSIKYETEKKEAQISSLEKQKVLYIIIGIIGVLLAMVVGIVSQQRIRRERMEKKFIAVNAVLDYEEQERKRLASELHDGINSMLSAIKIEFETIEHSEHIRYKLDECIETIRRMVRGMMPASLERYGLKAALEDYCRSFPNVRFHFFGENLRPDEKTERTLYYCAYELINNAFKHSGATNINVQLIRDFDNISLTVQDNGCSFDEKSVTKGSGLQNIRNRIATFNGKLDIISSPDRGTEIVIELKIKND